jgi:hypothetical protein
MAQKNAFRLISEMKEFASFTAAEQRYIRRSIDVAVLGTEAAERWSRNGSEQASINAQDRLYRTLLKLIRTAVPEDIAIDAAAEFIGPLITMSAFDLGEEKLTSFSAYRFLYERLLGGGVRPWLASAFLAAAGLPYLHPATRKSLLRSITEGDAAAPGWSHREPSFIPEWVEKVPVAVF